jgi:CRISPR/Cas system-associated exonuclease Cas4 (RecB family)
MGKTAHDMLVDRIKGELEAEGEKICSPRSWIKGPAEVDIIALSKELRMYHPLLILIEVKDDVKDLQRALYQILVARHCLHKDMCAYFYVALSQKLYEKLIRLDQMDIFLEIVNGPIGLYMVSGDFGAENQAKDSYTISRLGIGVVVLNEKEEKLWEKRTELGKADLMQV